METGVILIAGFAVVFLLVFIMTNLLLSQIVLRPVRLISETARKVSLGDFSVPEYSKPGKDEISSLATSFNLMRRSLERAMSMIDV
jgi:protein-histidine pros-kinase